LWEYSLNETTAGTWQVWNIYGLFRHLPIMVGVGSVPWPIFLNEFYRGKSFTAPSMFFYFLDLAVVPAVIAYTIVEI
jgi:hypothetical protein